MYEVYVESGPIEAGVSLDPVADQLAGNLHDIGRPALVGVDALSPVRRERPVVPGDRLDASDPCADVRIDLAPCD